MKLFTKQITIVFTVEHTSDDPGYEKRLSDAINQVMADGPYKLGFHSTLAEKGLLDDATCGGVRVDIKEDV